jgi:hypothetical protein
MLNTAQKALDATKSAALDLIAFSKLERIVAAVCMAIPFLLILADAQERIGFWPITMGVLTIMLIPLVVSAAAYKINDMAMRTGVVTFAAAFVSVAVLFYGWYWSLPPHFEVRDSISSYVSMENAHLFGLLLTTAAMLFIFNGAVYIKKVPEGDKKKHGKWYNLVLGLFLLGVILFPCTNPKLVVLHYVCAGFFFCGSAVVIAFFNDTEHRKLSIFIAAISVTGFVLNVLNLTALESFTLFWSESIALWVIGIHYILESMGKLS